MPTIFEINTTAKRIDLRNGETGTFTFKEGSFTIEITNITWSTSGIGGGSFSAKFWNNSIGNIRAIIIGINNHISYNIPINEDDNPWLSPTGVSFGFNALGHTLFRIEDSEGNTLHTIMCGALIEDYTTEYKYRQVVSFVMID